MAKTTTLDNNLAELKKFLKAGKVILGRDKTIKMLRFGNPVKIFLANNCPVSVQNDIMHYAKLASVPVVVLTQPNDELGTLCKKPYLVSVLSVSQ
jgi:large subunit ribosomal protein L30e